MCAWSERARVSDLVQVCRTPDHGAPGTTVMQASDKPCMGLLKSSAYIRRFSLIA
jgi:hypothetical protein